MIEITTNRSVEVLDITSIVEKILQERDLQSGICLIYTLHTTTGIIINEAEMGLIEDLVCSLTKIVPDNVGYQHDKIDSNAHAHLRAIIVGNSAVIPIENKKLILGSWQRLLFLEFDGPRRRKIVVKLISD